MRYCYDLNRHIKSFPFRRGLKGINMKMNQGRVLRLVGVALLILFYSLPASGQG